MSGALFLVLCDSREFDETDSLPPVARALAAQGARVGLIDRADEANAALYGDAAGTAVSGDTALCARFVGQDHPHEIQAAGESPMQQLANADGIWLRLPTGSCASCYERLAAMELRGTIINDPLGILRFMDKRALLDLKDVLGIHAPAMAICRSLDEVAAFQKSHGGPIVVKEPVSCGGNGVHKVEAGVLGKPRERGRIERILEAQKGALAMEFLAPSEGVQSDKRILVFEGTILGAFARHNPDDWRHNISQGAGIEKASVSAEEREMVARLEPRMRAAGIRFYGLDTLLHRDGRRRLSEINVADVGGLAEYEQLTGEPASYVMAERMLQAAQRGPGAGKGYLSKGEPWAR